MNLSKSQIIDLYKGARNKGEEMVILSELTLMDIDQLVEILKDAGVWDEKTLKKYKRCEECGAYIISRRSRRLCESCYQRYDTERRRIARMKRSKTIQNE